VSISLITLFYASLSLGIIFASWGGIVVGLVHIITFAGAISVMLLTVVLMTGESKLVIGRRQVALSLIVVSIPVVGATAYELIQGLPPSVPQSNALSLLQFLWEFRSWDLLIMIMVFAASMVSIANLLSRK
jgi:NADH:ubiquinone oxidoreductase subunit 6 (subunit J)